MGRPSQKEQILAAAGRLFSKKGYHATTIREIAEETGILSGSLYAHIQSKEDLLFEIVDEGAMAFLNSIEDIVNSPSDPVTKLRAGLAAHIQVIAEHLDASTVFFHEWQALSEPRREMIQKKRDQYEAQWAAILDAGAREGVFASRDPKFARLLILSVANWVYQWYRPTGNLSPSDIAERFTDVIVDGLKPVPSEEGTK
ncbi:TetR/AcrR family transcriptional regulator [Alicyclobacillus dauci]|uniref:TetR/AcrR family transcriptional regulator n=1 Tax=Alicyclobacillus dauci TaxID=1475485 RepID=A0ABY6YXH7_9BACL|nr:TetR/AcrR family transcriptional regulator [Alicyclobacillus dauci]WAH35170.1 TetR/AcrR family transcriptional regulator [Alicyclobacillus dauci]